MTKKVTLFQSPSNFWARMALGLAPADDILPVAGRARACDSEDLRGCRTDQPCLHQTARILTS